jgi:O-antigen biosynthesis protein
MIDVGIHVGPEVGRLGETIGALRRHALAGRLFVLLEPDTGPLDLGRQAAVEELRMVRAGGATALNTLVEASGAPVVVLLEAGVRVAPGALDRMERALSATVGLTGPSTNLSWNRQRQADAPNPDADPGTWESYARVVEGRFGDAVEELTPLHSLADFCLAVRRDVVISLGGADDAYDPGPCWEIDLNVRAHRAGWRGQWVKGAYVHRAPIPSFRRAREVEFTLANKRRFQDRFCRALVLGTRTDYRRHCRGDECAEFADPYVVGPILDRTRAVARVRASIPSGPLVSCILPVAGRPAAVAEAVRGFLRQDYPRRELVVVDDGDESLAHLLPVDDRIRHFRMVPRTLGAKRNFACWQARGELIAHFDHDSGYSPGRLTAQVRALVDAGASVCGTGRRFFLDAAGRAWLGSEPVRGSVAGESLLYARAFWEKHRFAHVQTGEYEEFVARARASSTLADMNDPALCVSPLRRSECGAMAPGPSGLRRVDIEAIRAILGPRLEAFQAAISGEPARLPLASCVMPTFDRPEFAAIAIEQFQAQDYPCKELVIVDDGLEPIASLVEGQPGVRYHRLNRRCGSLGEKRNVACSLAQGEIMCLWDDDDWYSAERLRCQVLPIVYDEADVTGLTCDRFLCLPSGEVWTVTGTIHRQMFEGDVTGGTIAFRSDVFEQIRFPPIDLAEDAAWIRMARARGYRLKRLAGREVFAYVRHPNNTWRFEPGRSFDPGAWSRAALPASFPGGRLAALQRAFYSWSARRNGAR